MNMVESQYREALRHLESARQAMLALTSLSDDWTACVGINQEFLELAESVVEFARCQHGIRLTATSSTRKRLAGRQRAGAVSAAVGTLFAANGSMARTGLG